MAEKSIDLAYVAKLARVSLTPDEEKQFREQLGDILGYMEKLNTLDTKDVPPTSHVLSLKNVFREDKVREGLSAEKSLSNAPLKKKGFFVVPKVIE